MLKPNIVSLSFIITSLFFFCGLYNQSDKISHNCLLYCYLKAFQKLFFLNSMKQHSLAYLILSIDICNMSICVN